MKKYVIPTITVEKFEVADIVTTSCDGHSSCPYETPCLNDE